MRPRPLCASPFLSLSHLARQPLHRTPTKQQLRYQTAACQSTLIGVVLQQQQDHQRGRGCNKKAYENIYNDQYEGARDREGRERGTCVGLVDANHVFRGIVFFFCGEIFS